MNSFLTKYSKAHKVIFFSSLVVTAYWLAPFIIPVYKYAVVGAFFETTWLIMVLLLFILPVVSLVFLAKEKFKFKPLLWLSFFISAGLLIAFTFFR